MLILYNFTVNPPRIFAENNSKFMQALKRSLIFFALLLTFLPTITTAQDMASYNGEWEGKYQESHTFNFLIEIENFPSEQAKLTIRNHKAILHHTFAATDATHFEVSLGERLSLGGRLSTDGQSISAFIRSGILMYHLRLKPSGEGKYQGQWDMLMVEQLANANIYLSVENGALDQYEAYPIWGDNRFTGSWCTNFQKAGNQLRFMDFKTGLEFVGELRKEEILLDMQLAGNSICQIPLRRSTKDWQIGGLANSDFSVANDWPTADASTAGIDATQLARLTDSIRANAFPNTHSILIAKAGELVYEENFAGYHSALPHDTRSASKSIGSAMIGIAIDQGDLPSTAARLYDWLPSEYQNMMDSLKRQIDLASLLTMSCGLDAIDFGLNRNSPASEGAYQSSPDWTQTILSAPILFAPNTHANYGSANPHLLGVVLDQALEQPVEFYMDEKLFQPLGIHHYIIQTDEKGSPYFGGGMYLNARDLLKFGQLYLNQGTWQGQRVIAQKWVERSFINYRPLENTIDKNGYGFLWWHHTYEAKGRTIATVEARGTGGQYIMVIPELDVVVVITAGNFRNGKTQQPEQIFERMILPALLP